MYFRQMMIEIKEFRNIGSWWQSKKEKDPCEIDIIGIYADDKRALVAEVKRQRKNFNPNDFNEKVEIVRNKVLYFILIFMVLALPPRTHICKFLVINKIKE